MLTMDVHYSHLSFSIAQMFARAALRSVSAVVRAFLFQIFP
jgi:hypothetical protein